MGARVVLSVLVAAAVALPALALERIYVVRHAEKVDAWLPGPETDAFRPLSPVGMSRAEALAEALAGAGVAAVYASGTTRALHTAFPLSRRVGAAVLVEGSTVDPRAMAGFLEQLEVAHAEDEAVLIVGHSNTVPALLVALGAVPGCFERLGVLSTPDGLRIEGHGGLWRIDLGEDGCDRITVGSVPPAPPVR